jgi:hypothetical protein
MINFPEPENKGDIVIDVTGGRVKKNKHVDPEKFIDLINRDLLNSKKSERVYNQVMKYLTDPSVFFSLDDKDKLRLAEIASQRQYKCEMSSFKLYEIAIKNEIFRNYLEDKKESRIESVKQDAKLRDIVDSIRLEAKNRESNNES